MDFNTLYETIAPYLSTGTIATAIVALGALLIKIKGLIGGAKKEINNFISDAKASWNSTENQALKAFKNAIPNELFIEIKTLAKNELSAIKEEIWNAVDERWVGQISKNTALMEAVATALIDNKTIPDTDKQAIADLLKKDAHTTSALKVELLEVKTNDVVEEKPSAENILID